MRALGKTSSIYSDQSDIDLLIEYDEHIVNIERAIQIRIEVREYLTINFGVDVNICLLNKTENETTQFITMERGVLLPLTKAISHGGTLDD